jgi:hypothetical protein
VQRSSRPRRSAIASSSPSARILTTSFGVLLEKVEKAKCGAAVKPRKASAIRPGTDTPTTKATRHVPRAVVREIGRRDGWQCAYVSRDGHRCSERVFLEKHHIQAYALGGPPTVENISLRCRRHNQHEAELVFGPREGPTLSP